MTLPYGQHAKALLMQLRQSDWMPEYNAAGVRNAISEANLLGEEVIETLKKNGFKLTDNTTAARLSVYREGLVRNRKCLLAYMQHRSGKIRSLRWQVGHPLPQKFRDRMSPEEYKYFTGYDEILNAYMRAVGKKKKKKCFCVCMFVYMCASLCICICMLVVGSTGQVGRYVE